VRDGALAGAVLAAGLAASLVLAPARIALATNATNLTGFSAAASGLGGADAASFLDTSAINANPATLSLLPPRGDPNAPGVFSAGRLDLSLGVLGPFLHHEDSFGNSRDGENNPFLALHGGGAVRLRGLPRLTFGLGMFSQGGLGTDFRDLNTAFGTRDDVSSFLRYTKLAAAVSWQATDDLAIGVAPHVGYSDLSLQLFPKTSSNGPDGAPGTADDFAGIDISDRCSRNFGVGEPGGTCPWDVVFGVKVGAVYRLGSTVTIGAAYTSPVDFHYRDGRMRLNLSNVGLGRVEYDVDVDGFTWPQAVEAGIAVRPTPRLLLALDVGWHDWSTLDKVTIRATSPNRSPAPARVKIPIQADWDDQWVVSAGVAWEVVPDVFTVRAGYNHGNNQVPDRTLSPAVCVIYEHHLTAGVGYRPDRHLQLDVGFTYALENRVAYGNRGMPFGANAVEAPAGLQVDLTLGYRF
jgi:long-chain fatty acid transport protein